jgi:hypothetical protein
MIHEHIPFDILSELHDHLLAPGEEERVRMHLKSCAQCRREFEEIGRMISMVAALHRSRPRDEHVLVRAAMARIRRKQRVYGFRRFVPTAAAAAVIILALSVDHISMKQDKAPQEMVAMRQSRESSRYEFPRFEVREISGRGDSTRTLSMLKRNNARIITVTDSMIEGEMPAHGFEEIAREIHNPPVATRSKPAQKADLAMDKAEEKKKEVRADESRAEAPAPEAEAAKPKGTMVRFKINLQSQ